jgi:Na+/phosphate symporter
VVSGPISCGLYLAKQHAWKLTIALPIVLGVNVYNEVSNEMVAVVASWLAWV